MAQLSKEELLAKYSEVIGDNNTDVALSLLEDISDTMDAMSESVAEDWKTKYEENDRAWREKYKARFFDTPSEEPVEEVEEGSEEEPTTFEELFD